MLTHVPVLRRIRQPHGFPDVAVFSCSAGENHLVLLPWVSDGQTVRNPLYLCTRTLLTCRLSLAFLNISSARRAFWGLCLEQPAQRRRRRRALPLQQGAVLAFTAWCWRGHSETYLRLPRAQKGLWAAWTGHAENRESVQQHLREFSVCSWPGMVCSGAVGWIY